MLTQARLKELLHYDPETGIFRWLTDICNVKAGDVAGTSKNDSSHKGRRAISIDRTTYHASRLAWLYIEGYLPEHEIDHINRDQTDDRWSNLRHVTRSCNARNCGVYKNNTSRVTGVRWDQKRKKWKVDISLSGRRKWLGRFEDFTEAVKVRWDAEVLYNYPNCNTTSSAYLYLKERNLI